MIDTHLWLQRLSFVLLFVGFWLTVTLLLSYVSGWAFLAKNYRAAQAFGGRYECIRIGQMGPLVSMGNALYVGVDPQGLNLRMFILFRVNCRDLFFPWSEITVTRGRSLFMDYVEFHFLHAPKIVLRIYGKAGEVIKTLAGPAWPAEAPRYVLER
jgi:hypothetical protein